ncbi:hypothetical protein ACQ4PT_023908 [Festuca glaucescens]
MAGCNGNSSASPVEQQTVTEKKFGGMAPKKPLISKDHERAYFDSADWVLGKQAANNSAEAAAIESFKPKLKVSHKKDSDRFCSVQLHCNTLHYKLSIIRSWTAV